jgi:light-regulated signal transduction histidine kinase (bacteriophytochrome)
VTRDDSPTVKADATQLVGNFIANCVEFRRSDLRPEGHVSARRFTQGWRFAVSDGSTGGEPRYVNRAFILFQLLHSRVEYHGRGIRLVICKRIVVRHGGVMTLQSQPERGTTVEFTLPHRGVP